MRKRIVGVAAFAPLLLGSIAFAQDVRDAKTLPARTAIVVLEPSLGLGTGYFGSKWQFLEPGSFVDDYDRRDLALALARNDESARTLESWIGQLGTTRFVANQSTLNLRLSLAYGITDRWLVAALLTYFRTEFHLEAWLEPGANPSRYRVRDPRGISCPKGELRLDDPTYVLSKVIEYGGDGYIFNVGDLRRALQSDCLGYVDPIDAIVMDGSDGLLHGRGTRTYSGLKDSILATRYQFWHTTRLDIAATFYVIAPTGRPDDPNDLFDPVFGDEQWDAALLVGATTHVGPAALSLTTGYEVQLPDTIDRRMNTVHFDRAREEQLARGEISEAELYDRYLDDGTIAPLTTTYDTARVRRRLGDNFYAYLSAKFSILDWLSLGTYVDFRHHLRDEIVDLGPRTLDGSRFLTSSEIRDEVDRLVEAGQIRAEDRVSALVDRLPSSAERRVAAYRWHGLRESLTAGVGVSVSTIEWFLRGQFWLPTIVGLSAQIPIAGKNNDAIYGVSLSITVPYQFGSTGSSGRDHGHHN